MSLLYSSFDLVGLTLKSVIKGALLGGRRLRLLFVIGAVSLLVAIIAAVLTEIVPDYRLRLKIVTWVFGVLAAFLIVGIAVYQNVLEESAHESAVLKVAQRAREHPNEPQAAWELAIIKLETYLNRNLRQIAWIFFLTLLVMIVGFVIVGYGVLKVYQSPDNFKPSIVVTLSGVLIEFIAADVLIDLSLHNGTGKRLCKHS
jgi:hypothetical protein